jgi:hypothetical protein
LETLPLAETERLSLWLREADELSLLETLADGWLDADVEVLSDALPLELRTADVETLPLAEAERLPLWLPDADELLLLETLAVGRLDADDEVLSEALLLPLIEEL